jgi:hypothetical protein
VARIGDTRVAYRVLVGRRYGKRPTGRCRRRRDDNIKMNVQEVGSRDMDCNAPAQDRNRWRALGTVVMNLLIP